MIIMLGQQVSTRSVPSKLGFMVPLLMAPFFISSVLPVSSQETLSTYKSVLTLNVYCI